jgi:hypothetical protein
MKRIAYERMSSYGIVTRNLVQGLLKTNSDNFYILFEEMRIKGKYNFNIQNKNPIIFDLGANIRDSVLYFK